MRKTTHRQYQGWLAWLAQQWNEPDRHDWYAMQIACEVRRVLSQKPGQHQPDQLKIKFEERKPLSEEDKRRHAENVKAAWIGMVGGKVEHRIKPKGNDAERA